MPTSAAMWGLLPPWQNLSSGAILSIWPCMPGFHRCSLGLHTPTCKLVKQRVSATEVTECPHNHSGQLWLTALPLAIIFSIFLVSISTQNYNMIDSTSNAPAILTPDQRVYIELPFRTRFASSWSLLTGNLGYYFSVKRFDPEFHRRNQSTSLPPVRITSEKSSSDNILEAGREPEHLQPPVERAAQPSSRLNSNLLSDSTFHSNEGKPQSQESRQHRKQEDSNRKLSSTMLHMTNLEVPTFRKLISLPNRTFSDAVQCNEPNCSLESQGDLCSERFVHIAMTLDVNYLRGSMAAIYSILLHAECPSNIRFHFVATNGKEELEKVVAETLPFLQFQTYTFDESSVKSRISHAVRHALEEPLNYARFYLAHMIDPCVKRIIYLDSDVLVLDRIEELWITNMGNSTVGTPEYCHANFSSVRVLDSGYSLLDFEEQYFTENFWKNSSLASTFADKQPCYFNSGMMLINLDRWRKTECTATLEYWMEVQKEQHIYELGSLPPLLLTFSGDIQAIANRWNQHGLGGDILRGDCRPTRNEPASLLHWSGGGKPWQRLDIQQPCPVDSIWAQYDLLEPIHLEKSIAI